MRPSILVSAGAMATDPSAQAVSQSASPSCPALPELTQQGLDGAAALLQPVAWVGGWEEDGCWQATGWGVQPEAHGGEEGLPARDATHFVLHTLLGCVHGIALPVLNALQGLLHLEGEERRRVRCCCAQGPALVSRSGFVIYEASAGHPGLRTMTLQQTVRLLEREAAEEEGCYNQSQQGLMQHGRMLPLP